MMPHMFFSPKCTTSTWVWAEKKSDSHFDLGFWLNGDFVKNSKVLLRVTDFFEEVLMYASR